MTLIGLIVVLVIVGVILWVVNTIIPMDPKIKTIINVVVVIAVLLWLLEAFGLLGGGIGLNRRIGQIMPPPAATAVASDDSLLLVPIFTP